MSMLLDKCAQGSTPGCAGRKPTRGKVILLGAGPGDPELITLKGLRSLRKADVVIYDRLIPLELLDEVPDSALRVFVGKKSGDYTLAQEEINHLLIFYAQQGHLVVRLKGGDPFVFGRGGEEALALVAAGIPFEVIPGISSAIAVPAAAGIPVTHRGLASSVTIVTGHEQAGSDSTVVDWERLATLGSTLVILMGVEALPYICQRLLRAGMAAETPAAVIEQGTLPTQRVVTAPVLEIAEEARKAGIKSPAIIVIGEVVAVGDVLASFSGNVSISRASGA